MAEGQQEREISNTLGMAAEEAHRAIERLFTLLGVSDAASAATKALALGLIVSGHYPRYSR